MNERPVVEPGGVSILISELQPRVGMRLYRDHGKLTYAAPECRISADEAREIARVLTDFASRREDAEEEALLGLKCPPNPHRLQEPKP